MGDHYDFELAVNLRECVPGDIVSILSYLLLPNHPEPSVVPDNGFFSENWKDYRFVNWVAESHPHTGFPICAFQKVHCYTQREIAHFIHKVHLRFEAKLEFVCEVGIAFAEWIAQFSNEDGFVGYFKGEHTTHPTLFYVHKGQLRLVEPQDLCPDDVLFNLPVPLPKRWWQLW